jgi:hypothetical protein
VRVRGRWSRPVRFAALTEKLGRFIIEGAIVRGVIHRVAQSCSINEAVLEERYRCAHAEPPGNVQNMVALLHNMGACMDDRAALRMMSPSADHPLASLAGLKDSTDCRGPLGYT